MSENTNFLTNSYSDENANFITSSCLINNSTGSIELVNSATTSSNLMNCVSNYSTLLGTSYNNTTATPSIGFFDPSDLYSEYAMKIFNVLSEDELRNLCAILNERMDSETFTQIMKRLIRNRHLSEDFIMDFASNLTKEDYFKMHEADIKSQTYSRLALMLAV